MSTTAVQTITNLEDGGYYLPSLSSGVLYIHHIDSEYANIRGVKLEPRHLLYTTAILLLAGILMHSLEKSVSGPESDRKLTSFETGVQRMYHSFYLQGKPSEYPTSWSKVQDIEYDLPKKRQLLAVVFLLHFILLFISYPITWIGLFSILPNETYSAGILLFLQSVFILRAFNEPLWPNSYIERENKSKLDIRDEGSEFTIFLSYIDSINVEDTKIETSKGGNYTIRYNIDYNGGTAILNSIESVCYAFAGTLAKGSYPCNRLTGVIVEDGEKCGEYIIKRRWVEELESGNISYEEFLDKVMESLCVTTESD